MVIDYTQLGLDFKLYSCQVLFNRALCYIELGEMDLAMTDLWRATREKQTKAHDILDQALRDKGQDCTVFTVPQGVLYRPPESKVKNSKKKDYLGNSKVIAAIDASDSFAGFQGKSAWQVQMSGPTNVAAAEEPRPMTPPNGKRDLLVRSMIDPCSSHFHNFKRKLFFFNPSVPLPKSNEHFSLSYHTRMGWDEPPKTVVLVFVFWMHVASIFLSYST